MKMNKIINLLSSNKPENNIEVSGWVKTFRANRFIAINDGSTILNLQCVIDFEKTDKSVLKRITTGAAIKVIGDLIESQGSGQKFEVKVNHILIIGDSDPDLYQFNPKNIV